MKKDEINFQCVYCNKIYIRKHAYNNHLTKCKFYKSRSNIIIKEEPDKNNLNIDNSTIFKLLIDLTNKYEKLESDYNELKKFVETNKKKVDILTYLNNNFNFNHFDFHDFINSISIEKKELEFIFQKDYVDGIVNIILNKIEELDNNIQLPLKGFSTKEGILYIYLKSNNGWLQLTNEELNKTIKYFNKNILNEFRVWKNEMQTKMNEDDYSEICILNMKKVLGGNFHNKNPNILIKNKLYKNIKTNVKSISSYEII